MERAGGVTILLSIKRKLPEKKQLELSDLKGAEIMEFILTSG